MPLLSTAPPTEAFLPKGFRFPLQIDTTSGRMRMTAAGPTPTEEEYVEHKRSNLKNILGTAVGFRVMTPSYGSRLGEVPFTPNDASPGGAGPLAQFYIQNAVRAWEPSISIKSVSLARNQALFDLGAAVILTDFTVQGVTGSHRVTTTRMDSPL